MKKLLVGLLSLVTSTGICQITYKDVAPIFFSRCTSCHHEGGAGPFPFMNYSQTIDHSIEIYAALSNGIMPPWSPDTNYTRFLHERIITDSEKNSILTWVMDNTPAGDTTLAPPPPSYSSSQLYGTPSMELQIPTFVSNAVSSDSYVCFSLPTNLTQDRYLRAFEIIPGNASIVHHVIVNVDTIGNTTNDLSGTCYTTPGDFGVGGFAPGAPPTVFPGEAPMKLGIAIKAGSRIVLQIHYPAGSVGMIDSTKIRLYFYPVNETGIRPVLVSTPLQNWTLAIPPDTIVEYSAIFPQLPFAASFLATFPHSHLLCKSIVNCATAGIDTIPLIRINNWDFEWQGYYTYRFPVKIPIGYELYSSHVYDNTVLNPNNPFNPPQTVISGFSTTDEMLFDSFQWTFYLPGDEFVDVGAILDGDTLLSALPNHPSEEFPFWTSSVFPNPANDNTTIRINTNKKGTYFVNIYDLRGNQVSMPLAAKEIYGSYFVNWDGRSINGDRVSPGIYFYKVESGNNKTVGKLVWIPED